MRVLEFVTGVYADVQGVGDASVTDLPIVLGASLVEKTNRGPIIGLFPQYAYYGKGRTIHSAVQMEALVSTSMRSQERRDIQDSKGLSHQMAVSYL